VSARYVALLIVVASAPAAALAQPVAESPATQHFDRGATLAREQKYQEAAREFQTSYELEPKKEALFAWAQVARLGGDCAAAVDLYRKFLRSPDLTAEQIEATQLGLARCESAPRPAPPVAVPPPAPAIARTPPPLVITEPRRSGQAVALGATLLGGAVVALGAGGTFYYLSRRDESDAGEAGTWGDYYRKADRARGRQRWAFGLLGAGLLLGGGALAEWLATSPGRPAATAWVGRDGAGVAVRGTY
jgi:hypothetical protein